MAAVRGEALGTGSAAGAAVRDVNYIIPHFVVTEPLVGLAGLIAVAYGGRHVRDRGWS